MGTTENVELVRRGYEAFNTGDAATLSGMFAEDAVWHVGGSGVLSGMKQGRDAVLAYFGELASRTNGDFQATLKDIVGGENYTIAVQQTKATNNGKTLDLPTIITFVVRDGKITEGREYFEESGKFDDFWA